jgi:mono/diheme cytochrome c family protein
MLHRHRIAIALIVVLAGVALAAGVWRSLLPGLSSARNEPSAAEVLIATWLLQESVPTAAKKMVNPLGGDPADIAAGRNIFRQKCEICHGYDGSGKTEVGAGQYPRPPALQANIAAMPDGEIFYHIRNGIRNTGMVDAGYSDLAACGLPSPSASGHLDVVGAAGCRNRRYGPLSRLCSMSVVPYRHLRSVEQDPDGERRPRSEAASGRDHP